MEITQSPSIGSFVANDYRTAAVFQKYGIDFCCKGVKSIDEVCENKKINAGQLLTELAEVTGQPDNQLTDFQSWPLDLLADYIEKKHHRYIEETTPSLKQFLDKLCKVHGSNHPELFEITKEFNQGEKPNATKENIDKAFEVGATMEKIKTKYIVSEELVEYFNSKTK